MAWEWVSPTATAAVGIAGVVGTWLTAKGGRDHAATLARDSYAADRSKAIREERRTAYLDFLASVGQVERAAVAIRRTDADAKPGAILALQNAHHACADAYFAVGLVGPLAVTKAADALLSNASTITKEAIETDGAARHTVHGGLTRTLHVEMQKALQYDDADQMRTNEGSDE